MSAADLAASLLTLAEHDLRAARLLTAEVPDVAAYHLQQAAEKAGKALLVLAGIDPERVHRIGRLAEALSHDHPLREALYGLDSLSRYSTAMRYPDAAGRLPVAPEGEQLKRDAEAVARFVEAARLHARQAQDPTGGQEQ